ncbi:TonB-dependent receptor domain-containing protein [Aliidiomarina celeris]|uniref:TonB-dependent receptor domain-containing protein n=1 Tax=Aliidiomarina celeris TaxID=2249428 RepID=UPI000DEBDEA6|nr:TonB-dependent receptor [Aliidiomarina celeris]
MSTHVERSEESCNGVWKKKKTQVASGQLPLFEFSPDNLAQLGKHQPHINGKDDQFSRYIVYVDESGNHNLQSIDPQYPIFVLAFCVFHKRHYSEVIVPTLEKFKFNHFGHDQIVLHENEIRRRTGQFNIFRSRQHQLAFMSELTEIIEFSNFVLISATIDKRHLAKANPEDNAYHIAYTLTPDMMLRAAWTNTIARPSFSDISPRASVDREDLEVELGNPDLDPYEAMNFDLVFDWYYAEGSVFTLGAFYKDIDNYVVEVTSNNVPEYAGFDVTRPTNSTSASVMGVEANWLHNFVDGPMQGVLLGANLTVLDTELELLERTNETFALPEAAELTANAFVGYEKGAFSTRLSWTHRDKYLQEVGDDSRYDLYVKAHTQLDWTASYQFSKGFELVAEVTNITDEPLELYQGTPSYTLQFEEYGPTLALGFKGRF